MSRLPGGGFSTGALIAHAIDAPDHLNEWWVYSTVFIILGAFQFFYALVLFLRPWLYDETGAYRANPKQYGRIFYIFGIVLASLVVGVYVIGPHVRASFYNPGGSCRSSHGAQLCSRSGEYSDAVFPRQTILSNPGLSLVSLPPQ
jgi:hypothetical protein